MLGISFDSIDENRKFREKFAFPFRLLCDIDRKIGLAYGACKDAKDTYAKRIGYLIDTTGEIKKAYPTVDAKAFPEQVLADI